MVMSSLDEWWDNCAKKILSLPEQLAWISPVKTTGHSIPNKAYSGRTHGTRYMLKIKGVPNIRTVQTQR
jgi:hypothetical protein